MWLTLLTILPGELLSFSFFRRPPSFACWIYSQIIIDWFMKTFALSNTPSVEMQSSASNLSVPVTHQFIPFPLLHSLKESVILVWTHVRSPFFLIFADFSTSAILWTVPSQFPYPSVFPPNYPQGVNEISLRRRFFFLWKYEKLVLVVSKHLSPPTTVSALCHHYNGSAIDTLFLPPFHLL